MRSEHKKKRYGSKIEVICKTCNISFLKCCYDIKNSPNHFCSRSCACKYNNKYHPKIKKKKYTCCICNIETGRRQKYCKEHHPFNKKWDEITLEFDQNKRKYQINSRIRNLARVAYQKSDQPKYCINCGYNQHYEVCHIKAIKDFDRSSTIGEINNINNLIALCPNCHWEFDHGKLTLEQIEQNRSIRIPT